MRMLNYFKGVEIVSDEFLVNGQTTRYQLIITNGEFKFELISYTNMSQSQCMSTMQEALEYKNSMLPGTTKLESATIMHKVIRGAYTYFECTGKAIED